MEQAGQKNILIVEDEAVLRKTLQYNLEKEGYAVETASEGYEALERFEKRSFDLILLDVMLPGLSGFELCQIIRRQDRALPIILLTARRDELDKVAGLDLGADDYVTKPFSLRELMARIRAALRRSAAMAEADTVARAEPAAAGPDAARAAAAAAGVAPVTATGAGRAGGPVLEVAGDLVLDVSRHEARIGRQALTTSRKEFDLLRLLAASSGAVVTRQLAMEKVWGYDFPGDDRTLDVHIAWLRQKLAKAGATARITTVRGVGYRLDAEAPPKDETRA